MISSGTYSFCFKPMGAFVVSRSSDGTAGFQMNARGIGFFRSSEHGFAAAIERSEGWCAAAPGGVCFTEHLGGRSSEAVGRLKVRLAAGSAVIWLRPSTFGMSADSAGQFVGMGLQVNVPEVELLFDANGAADAFIEECTLDLTGMLS